MLCLVICMYLFMLVVRLFLWLGRVLGLWGKICGLLIFVRWFSFGLLLVCRKLLKF